MANRPAWTVTKEGILIRSFDFEWAAGLNIKQKQKNIASLHNSIKDATGGEALEISTKGMMPLGNELSAFVLKLDDVLLENIFQSSKRYENGGPYRDLLDVSPKEAKTDDRHKTSGKLLSFEWNGISWPLEPKTLFYDYIYVTAVSKKFGFDSGLLVQYDWFTDIEFNPEKSINCQARAAALYKYICMQDAADVLDSLDKWTEFHRKWVKG